MLMSCEDYLDIGLPNSEISSELVLENDKTALSALDGIYYRLQSGGFASGTNPSVAFSLANYTDELINHSSRPELVEIGTSDLKADNPQISLLWNSMYETIYRCNALLEGVKDNTSLTLETIATIKGETLFIRSFTYYYLTQLFGDIPLVLSTDFEINSQSKRAELVDVYHQIESDLKEAIEILPFSYENNDRTKPNRFSALTLLSRLALTQEKWEEAYSYTSEIIGAGIYELVELDEVFLSNSKEAIWQLIPLNYPSLGTNEANSLILINSPEMDYFATSSLSLHIVENMEELDDRKSDWINYFQSGEINYPYAFKYKHRTGNSGVIEYSMVLRFSEIYLLRAEALFNLNRNDEALNDLNKIRFRSKASEILAVGDDWKNLLLLEVQNELFSEWGHRFIILKRLNKIDEVLSSKKENWSPYSKLLPIPTNEIIRNPNLTQNPGY